MSTGIFAQNIHQKGVYCMARLVRKNVFLDLDVLRRAQEILGVQSESKTVREALSLVAFRQEVMRGFDQAAGKAPDFRGMWEEP
jgi:hypothetical protein